MQELILESNSSKPSPAEAEVLLGKWPRHGSTKCILHRDLLSHKLLFLSALCTVAIAIYGSVGCWLATFSRQSYVANNMNMESTTGDRLFQVFKFILLLFPKFSPYSLRKKACHFLRKTGWKSLTCHVTHYRELNECESQERDKFLRFLIHDEGHFGREDKGTFL
ncbi:hypothetical protein B0J14DRAFT_276904 [Halenospora varia]|nr:hypothetical protein B0J14DRAFT_276904 [Halenospora varia]